MPLPLQRPMNSLADARNTCALPGCDAPVVPPRVYCDDAHKAAGNRIKGVTTLALYEALQRAGTGVTAHQAATILRKVGLAVVVAFVERHGWTWDEKGREWRNTDADAT